VRASEEGASRDSQPCFRIEVRRKASGPFDPLRVAPCQEWRATPLYRTSRPSS
jgi:hypothetical protein